MGGWIDLIENEIESDALERIRQMPQGKRNIADYLLMNNLVPERRLLTAMAQFYEIPFIKLSSYHPDKDLLLQVPEDLVRRFQVFPLFRIGEQMFVATSTPDNIEVFDYLWKLTGLYIEYVLATSKDIEATINRHFITKEKCEETIGAFADRRNAETDDLMEVRIEDDEAPVIKLTNYLIAQGINLRASDIHLEPFPTRALLRYRIDGVLHESPPPPLNLLRSIITRVKIMANMDVVEHRLPQDGRAEFRVDGRAYDLRISIIPDMHGESLVARILDSDAKILDLTELGFNERLLARYEELITSSFGIILVTGPTGSGKSTTLYATLKHLYTPKKKFITLEDPVECFIDGITQIQVHPEIGFTFAQGLRSVLRHDPEVAMVGEIRDLETAEIAIRTSNTGHLVFSTLHTNTAPSAVIRLIDMGVEPFLVISSIVGVIAQRLVRRLCPDCRTPSKIPASEYVDIPGDAITYEPKGCINCSGLGYKGRIAVYEILEITPEIRAINPRELTPDRIRSAAEKKGFSTMRHEAVNLMLRGITSLEEVLNNTPKT